MKINYGKLVGAHVADGGTAVELRVESISPDGLSAIHQIMSGVQVVVGIDGSTTCTGVSFVRYPSGEYFGSLALTRDKDETPVEYKVSFKKVMADILKSKSVLAVAYEEPFIGYASASKNLLMLRTAIEELIVENRPNLDHFKYIEVANGRWKKQFLGGKVPKGTDAQKKAIRDTIEKAIPILKPLTQDEMDAYGLGFVTLKNLVTHTDEGLKSKQKVRPFAYCLEFLYAESFEDAAHMVFNMDSVPKEIIQDGCRCADIRLPRRLDDMVYEHIGHDDILVIFRLPVRKCGNIILKYRLNVDMNEEFLYIAAWRKTRKR